jgi:hypothetical protein
MNRREQSGHELDGKNSWLSGYEIWGSFTNRKNSSFDVDFMLRYFEEYEI